MAENDKQYRRSQYECYRCGARISAAVGPGPCPVCGGPMANLSVSRD